jgi:hypothetical protein
VCFNPARPPLGVYGALFSISYQYDNPVTTFILTLDTTTDCVVSSSAKPFDEAERIRFGGAAK